MDIGEGSRSLPVEILVIEVIEGSELGARIGMDEIAQSVKNAISPKKLDHLLKMDVNKLRRLTDNI